MIPCAELLLYRHHTLVKRLISAWHAREHIRNCFILPLPSQPRTHRNYLFWLDHYCPRKLKKTWEMKCVVAADLTAWVRDLWANCEVADVSDPFQVKLSVVRPCDVLTSIACCGSHLLLRIVYLTNRRTSYEMMLTFQGVSKSVTLLKWKSKSSYFVTITNCSHNLVDSVASVAWNLVIFPGVSSLWGMWALSRPLAQFLTPYP